MILRHDLLINVKTASYFRSLPRTERVIDVGCGVRPCPVFPCKEYVCIEPHHEYVEVLKTWRAPADKLTIVHDTVDKLADQPRKGSTVLLLDVIEHMERDAGLEVLKLLREFDHAVVFTPLGWYEQSDQNPDDWGYNGGFWQKHRSAWQPEDFKDGWSVAVWPAFHLRKGVGAILAIR